MVVSICRDRSVLPSCCPSTQGSSRCPADDVAQDRLHAVCIHLRNSTKLALLLLCCLCRYCVSAKTGYNVQNALASITAQLAGLPLQLELASLPTVQQQNNDIVADTQPIGKRPRLLQALRRLARCCPCS